MPSQVSTLVMASGKRAASTSPNITPIRTPRRNLAMRTSHKPIPSKTHFTTERRRPKLGQGGTGRSSQGNEPAFALKGFGAAVSAAARRRLEATPGIEPGYADLQSAASPLRHVA